MLEVSGMKHLGVASWAQGRTTGGMGRAPLSHGGHREGQRGGGGALLALVTLPVLGSETFLRPPLSDLGHGDAGVGSSEALPPPARVMILG